MAQKGIREFDAKQLLARFLPEFTSAVKYGGEAVLVSPETDMKLPAADNPWLGKRKLVVKPDQLFGKRKQNKLLLLNADLDAVKKWIKKRMGKEVTVGKTRGKLTHFLIEPFVPHDKEYYVAIRSNREGDTLFFSLEGGVEIEENWDKVSQLEVPILDNAESLDLGSLVPAGLGKERKKVMDFIRGLFRFYRELNFTYLEINPFTLVGDSVVPLDMVARLDDTAAFECVHYWGGLKFPSPFGREPSSEENYIAALDEKTGASLKLTVLNPDGRIWLMVAGGGASVIYTDTVVDLKATDELANYGEYSGDPSADLTREYARVILDLMTRKKHPQGKVLLIGGGIANFTDIAGTFTGIIQALTEYREKLIKHKVRVYVRRGGPNYKVGLENMRRLGDTLGVPIEVYGPETHMTTIVPMAIKAIGL